MANGDDVLAGVVMPPWLKVLLSILKTYGVATVIALWLVYVMTHTVVSGITEIKDEMTAANKAMSAFASRQDAYDKERSELLKVQLRISRQTCANAAKNDDQKRGCWE